MNQLKAGAILNYCIIFLNSFLGILYTPFLIRMLGQSEFGLYSLVASIISYLTILDLGLGNAIVRYTAKLRAEGKQKEQFELFGMFLIMYLAIGVITLFAGILLYLNIESFFGNTMTHIEIEHAKIMILILVFNLAVTFPMSIFGSIIIAYERFVFPKIINIARILLNTLVMIVLLLYGYKAVAMVIVQTIFNLLSLFINYYYCKHNLKIKVKYAKVKFVVVEEILFYSFWILLDVVITKVYWSTGQFVLGAVAGTAAIAVFAVAIQLQNMYMQFSSAISSVFLPKVTQMVSNEKSYKDISDLFVKTGRVQNFVIIFILFSFIIYGRQFVVVWAGKEYAESYFMTLLFFIALYIPSIQNLGITILQARNQMKFRSVLFVAIAIVSLVFQFLLAKLWGGIGCSIAIAGALFLGQGIILNIYYYRKQHLDILSFWKQIIKMNIPPTMLLFAVLLLSYFYALDGWLGILIYGLLFSISYIVVTYRFSLNDYEKNLLIKPILNVIHVKYKG